MRHDGPTGSLLPRPRPRRRPAARPGVPPASPRPAHARALTALAALGGAAVLAGCSAPVADVEPAPEATDPLCAEAMVSLPDAVAGHERRETDSQATAAWGDPAAVILRCGVPTPGPTTEHCVTANGVDWVTRDDGEFWTLTTYGRTPAIEVLFDDTRAGSSSVMVDLASAVARVPASGGCTSAPSQTIPGASPSP
ncbi:DUF3515 domain-containing protein [Citricoccus sp. SGAir0253]|uniref:DUF3515 domain-containing protein n=1 Tax=Citricoccus sp. SGAir0253 TaxID=2567881 RepID=UPI0010CCD797|nr:DUF3515 domain-containing protein [Citricoccus sp. SGAir0253]QCU78371.1 DUF3515 domain-containing protein [Citricoccus sp. SGAir0253]